jgi:PEP-CTERM motif-containing protein
MLKLSLSPPIAKIVLSAVLLLTAVGNLSAVQLACPVAPTLDALITQTAGGIANACFSQDKLFWNFVYTPTGSAPAASTVHADLISQQSPGLDIHGWNFSDVWVQGLAGPAQFTLSFTIQVCPAGSACVGNVAPGTVINGADAVYAPVSTFMPGPETVNWSNGATGTLTSVSPGPVPSNGNIGLGAGITTPITVTANFSGTGAITQTTLRFYESVPTAGGVPEPATMVLLGIGLAGLGIIKRRRQA